MKTSKIIKTTTVLFLATSILKPFSSQAQKVSNDEVREQWVQLSKTGENHELLSNLNGNWTFTGRHISPDPNKRPFEFKGYCKRRELWGGRYFIGETTSGGKMKMPWSADSLVAYQDMSIEGYDNIKKKFFLSAFQNEANTGIIMMEGVYDDDTKTLTYQTETTAHMHNDIPPGTPFKIVWIITFMDRDHFDLTAKESVQDKPIVTTELKYTRVKPG